MLQHVNADTNSNASVFNLGFVYFLACCKSSLITAWYDSKDKKVFQNQILCRVAPCNT
jgi:hypothetical protein